MHVDMPYNVRLCYAMRYYAVSELRPFLPPVSCKTICPIAFQSLMIRDIRAASKPTFESFLLDVARQTALQYDQLQRPTPAKALLKNHSRAKDEEVFVPSVEPN